MEAEIKRLLNESIINDFSKNWATDLSQIKLLGDVENFVYEINNCFILRITHSSHRSKDLIQAELDWLKYLIDNELNVCTPILSKNNNYIETIDLDNGYFIACAFKKLTGYRLETNNQNDDIVKNLGNLVGNLHLLSKEYGPNKNFRRQQWFEESNNSDYLIYLPKSKVKIITEIEQINNKFMSLAKSKDSYGLIHADIHTGNFFINNNQIILFDFDDSCYSWYIYDIAIIIYSYLTLNDNINKIDNIKRFTNTLIDSYMQVNKTFDINISFLQDIFRYRDLMLFVFVHKKWDVNNMNNKQKEYYDKLENRIINNLELINVEKIIR